MSAAGLGVATEDEIQEFNQNDSDGSESDQFYNFNKSTKISHAKYLSSMLTKFTSSDFYFYF